MCWNGLFYSKLSLCCIILRLVLKIGYLKTSQWALARLHYLQPPGKSLPRLIAEPGTGFCWLPLPCRYLVSIQDLRDMAGDRVAGRQTFPLVFGETITRAKLSLCFGILPLVTHWLVMLPANYSWNSLICEGLMAGLSWVIAYRVWFLRSPQADHRSYMLYTDWFCLVVVSAIIVA